MSPRPEVSLLSASLWGLLLAEKMVKCDYLLLPEFWKHPEKINTEKCCNFVNPLTLFLAFCQSLYALSRHRNLLGSARKLTLPPSSQWSLPTSFLPTHRTRENNKTIKNDIEEMERQKYPFCPQTLLRLPPLPPFLPCSFLPPPVPFFLSCLWSVSASSPGFTLSLTAC